MEYLTRFRLSTLRHLLTVVTILIFTLNLRLTSAIEVSTCAAFGDLSITGNPFLSVFLNYDSVTNGVISLQASNGNVNNFAETIHKLYPFCVSELQGVSFTVSKLSGYDCLAPVCNYLFYCIWSKCILSYKTTKGVYKSINTIYVSVTNSPLSTCLAIPYLQAYNASISASSANSGSTAAISSGGWIGLITGIVVIFLICMFIMAYVCVRQYKLTNRSKFKQGVDLPQSIADVYPDSPLIRQDEQDDLEDRDAKAYETRLSRRDSISRVSKMRE